MKTVQAGKQLQITLVIDPASAVLEGNDRVGEVTVELTTEDLATLTPRQRQTLARHVGKWPSYRRRLSEGHKIGNARIETIAMLLDRLEDAVEANERGSAKSR